MGEQRMYMSDSSFKLSVIAESEKVFMFAHEALPVGEAAFEFREHGDDIPIVGHFLRAVGIEAEAAAVHLVDTDVARHGSQVDEHVRRGAVPPLAQESPRADQAACHTAVEQFGDHQHIGACVPVAAAAHDFE